METELSHRVNFTRKRKGSSEDETHPSRKMRCFPGDKIKDDEPFLNRKISYPVDKIEEKPCHSLKISSYPEDNIDDDEPCPSRKITCHSREKSKSRSDIHKVNEDFELELSTIESMSNSYNDNETKPSDENKSIQGNAKFALNKDVTVSADSAYISCNVNSTTSADLDELVSEGDGKVLDKKKATQIDENPQQAEYVYRLLRPDELYMEGLRPKNIKSKASLNQHVAAGSKGVHSRFISCCYTLHALRRLAGLTNQPSLEREVVRINITKLNRDEVKVIELFIENVRKKHIKVGSKAWGFAEKFDEVILEPKTHVPADCIERIGIVKDNVFTKDEHITL